MKQVKSFLRLLSISKISMFGAASVTSAFLADVILILGEVFLFESNPYIGIAAYLLLPGLFVFGLVLIPFGIVYRVKRSHRKLSLKAIAELIELQEAQHGRSIRVVFPLSMLNLVILGIVAYRGFHYTESTAFCGELCHKVMHPELTTYLRSPHSQIHCVECHIGPGAGWFVKSKLSGLRQVWGVLADDFSRPIQTPIDNLRPAREVCEVCHRPEIFHGDLIKVIRHFEPDEKNTELYTILNLRVGSGGEHGTPAHGIHWHVSKKNKLRYYATDHKREDIVWVELKSSEGDRHVWTRTGREFSEDAFEPEKLRLMDCVDCHNRPTHIYLTPEKALDEWMVAGKLDPDIPWLRKVSEEVLARSYSTTEEAMAGIQDLATIYQQRYPDVWSKLKDRINAQIPVLQEIHRLFVYPEMHIRWNTYSSRIGHPTPYTSACFRCHDGTLKDSDGKAITSDCNVCHYVLANRETNPLALKTLQGRRAP